MFAFLSHCPGGAEVKGARNTEDGESGTVDRQ